MGKDYLQEMFEEKEEKMITDSVYTPAPIISKWEDSICKHPRIMFNMCWVCKEEFEGINRSVVEKFLKMNGFDDEKIKELLPEENK